MSRLLPVSLLAVQVAAAIACFAVIGLWPPVSGRMLLIPVRPGDGSPAVAAVAAGALLLGNGPLPGSLVVVGDRTRLLARTASQAILVLAAPPAGCGSDGGRALGA